MSLPKSISVRSRFLWEGGRGGEWGEGNSKRCLKWGGGRSLRILSKNIST